MLSRAMLYTLYKFELMSLNSPISPKTLSVVRETSEYSLNSEVLRLNSELTVLEIVTTPLVSTVVITYFLRITVLSGVAFKTNAKTV